MMWELIVCIGVTWLGCASVAVSPYPSEESCYRSLAAMKTGDQPVAESQNKRNTVAYCRPAEVKKK